ncbi:MAG: hypothetical protein SFX18_02445 [Pirellulales bacterium]|nr:hypothetical protein [Pirellulales bacterium]
MSLALVIIWPALTHAAEPEIADGARKINAGILKANLQRVGVFPCLLQQESDSSGVTSAKFVRTPHSELYTEQLQGLLLDTSGGNYQVVDTLDMAAGLADSKLDVSQLKGSAREFQPLVKRIDGGLDGLVVGTIRYRPMDPNDFRNFYQARDIIWKLYKTADNSVVAQDVVEKPYTIADEVYQGLSREFFRWEGNVLRPIGFGYAMPPIKDIGLKPSDPLDLYGLMREDKNNSQPHPIFNPRCPYKVEIVVDDQPRGLYVPLSPEPQRMTGKVGVWEGQLTEAQRAALPLGQSLRSDNVYVRLNPGEEFYIHVKNTSPRRVLVAVLVDGVNILGKNKEIPDESCKIWTLDAGKEGRFRGWYTGEAGKEQRENFVVTRFENSIAAKLGVTDRVGTITVVFFNEGLPQRRQIAPYERQYMVESYFDPRSKQIHVYEGEVPEPRDITTSAQPGDPGLGIGGKKPVASPLGRLQKVQASGTILAAMTINYATKEEIVQVEERRKNLNQFAGFGTPLPPAEVGADGKATPPPPPPSTEWVEVPTSWK